MTGVWVKNCESVVVICRRCRDQLFWSSWAPNPSSRFCSSRPSRKLNWRYPNICKAACARVLHWCTLGANLVGLEQPPVPVACGDTVFWLWKTEIFEKLSHCTNSTANTGLGKSFSDVIGRFFGGKWANLLRGVFFSVWDNFEGFFFPDSSYMGWINTIGGRMAEMDSKLEFLAQKHPKTIQIVFSPIFKVGCTPSHPVWRVYLGGLPP